MKFFDKLCLILTCVTLALFIFMCISNHFIGGNATNGYREDGRYYVQNNVGENIPTSPILWYINYLISLAFVILMPLGMLSLLYLWIKYVLYLVKEMGKVVTTMKLKKNALVFFFVARRINLILSVLLYVCNLSTLIIERQN